MPKLLAIGDVHLGTRPASVPEEATDWGVDLQRLTPAAGLEAAVRLAIDEQVDAVVFAGDVVESTNARYEAVRYLEAAVRELLAAGIDVLGVVGNHDVEALPRLARLIPGFRLLGEGGQWQSVVVERAGQPICEIVGWSFPQRQVTSSPVTQLIGGALPPRTPGVPRIGVMHCDLDASGGPYAPVATRELAQTGIDTWLLGHIHKPSLGEPRADYPNLRAGYLGSLVGLHPNEVGDRGPWLVELSAGATSLVHVPNAPLRWEALELPVEPDQGPEDLGDLLLERVESRIREIHSRGIEPAALGLRIRLTGKTARYREVDDWVESGRWREISRSVAGTTAFVNKVSNATELARDLQELAKGDEPPGLLARKLLLLEGAGEDRDALIAGARAKLREVAEAASFSPLRDLRDGEDPLTDDAIANTLKVSGAAALSELLDQRKEQIHGEGAEQ
jgi:DNA repair exonuclease SbcCD nuclease subunit